MNKNYCFFDICLRTKISRIKNFRKFSKIFAKFTWQRLKKLGLFSYFRWLCTRYSGHDKSTHNPIDMYSYYYIILKITFLVSGVGVWIDFNNQIFFQMKEESQTKMMSQIWLIAMCLLRMFCFFSLSFSLIPFISLYIESFVRSLT